MKKGLIYLFFITILITSVTILMLNRDNDINEDLKIEIAPIPEKTVEQVTLFFKDKGNQYLVKENRVIEHTIEQREKLILEELFKGPVNEKNLAAIPENTKLYSVVIKNDTAYVNLSNEFKSDMQFGRNNEVLATYSIVNTLTELKTIKNVRLIVEGEEKGILQKHMPLDYLYKQNTKLVNNPIKTPLDVVKDYFSLLDTEDYRQAFDLLYNPANINLDYSMYYHYEKDLEIRKHNIYSYEMIEEGEFAVVKLDYTETTWTGEELNYKDKEFKLKNQYGEWKIVIENLPKYFNSNVLQ